MADSEEKPPPQKRKGCGQYMASFKKFMWNPRTREVMGRTGTSWALIVLFYVVFYIFLTALFSLTMWVMLQTIDDYTPKYTDRLSNPGLMMRPNSDTLDIVYNHLDSSTWNATVQSLNKFLQDYNDTVQTDKNDFCLPGKYNIQDDSGDVRNHPKKACQFNLTSLGNCSGIGDSNYGYSNKEPCVFIKLNRVINFLPVAVVPNQNYITVNCSENVKSGKTSNLVLSYYPNNAGGNSTGNGTAQGTIDLMYYPYYGKKAQANYSQPIVAVKFTQVQLDQDYNIQCSVYAKNIQFDDRDKFAGRVNFKLHIK